MVTKRGPKKKNYPESLQSCSSQTPLPNAFGNLCTSQPVQNRSVCLPIPFKKMKKEKGLKQKGQQSLTKALKKHRGTKIDHFFGRGVCVAPFAAELRHCFAVRSHGLALQPDIPKLQPLQQQNCFKNN